MFICSRLVHRASCLITESNQVSQIWFVLGKATLAVLNHLIYLPMPSNGFQEDLFHNLPRNWEETIPCTVPWISFISLLKVGMLFTFLQSLETSHNHYKLSKKLGNRPLTITATLDAHPAVLVCLHGLFTQSSSNIGSISLPQTLQVGTEVCEASDERPKESTWRFSNLKMEKH